MKLQGLGALVACCLLVLAPSGPALAKSKPAVWVPTWYAAPEPNGWDPVELKDTTVRQVVHVSAGGTGLRLRLSNMYGTTPLHIDAISVAPRATGSAIVPDASRGVTFQGQTGVTIAPGAQVLSDPIAFTVAPYSDLSVSLYAAGPVKTGTMHVVQRNAAYFATGNQVASETLSNLAANPPSGQSWLWLSEVEVSGSKAKKTVVLFGDSITDGVGPLNDINATWPDYLGQRFKDKKIDMGVANAAISGNRLANNGGWAAFGIAGLARFDSDVLAQPNVGAVIVALGINDIGQVGAGAPPEQFQSAQAIEDGLSQLAERAHDRGLKIYVGTLMPFRDTTIKDYFSEDKEKIRQAVNAWIRSQTVFDGVADFDRALEDPAVPGKMLALYDCGDHLHPSAEGNKAIADAVPLKWFK